MKITDQPDAKLRHAKLRLWAARPTVVATPRIANLPAFGRQSFDSYAAFNAWKKELLLELVRRGGAKWTR